METAALFADQTEEPEEPGLVPYAPEFTPATLGKIIGEDAVLPWLLKQAQSLHQRGPLHEIIIETCFAGDASQASKRDMASHVIAGLRNYLLIDIDDDETVSLTSMGETLLNAGTERDAIFARHILASCGGFRLVEAIQKHELRGSAPKMEDLNEALGQHPTSKNISSVRSWLARAGVLSSKGTYRVNEACLTELVGAGVYQMLGLEPAQVEFMLAARILAMSSGAEFVEAPDVRKLAETRAPDVKIPSKALGAFVARLAARKLVENVETVRGKGGTRVALRLTVEGINVSDDQLRLFLQQSAVGIALAELGTMKSAIAELASGTPDAQGRAGERLAVHICLMLGLRITAWRPKMPVEIDLTAERAVALSYQRWHIQVKNVVGDLTADRVDREIGAAAGTGATHLLFIIPRGGISSTARIEAVTKSRLTHLHVMWMTQEHLKTLGPISLLKSLEGQQAVLVREKRFEAERRERGR